MKTICVFLSAQSPGPVYEKVTKELGKLMVKNGYDLVWGGSDHGLMKLIADSVQENGGKIYGVSVKVLAHKARKVADEMFVAEAHWQRRKMLLEKADAVIALPGGNGTLDEITEAIELRKLGEYNKPIVFLNTDNFYLHLKKHYQMLEQKGFLPLALDEIVHFADTPKQALEYINKKIEKGEKIINPYLG